MDILALQVRKNHLVASFRKFVRMDASGQGLDHTPAVPGQAALRANYAAQRLLRLEGQGGLAPDPALRDEMRESLKSMIMANLARGTAAGGIPFAAAASASSGTLLRLENNEENRQLARMACGLEARLHNETLRSRPA